MDFVCSRWSLSADLKWRAAHNRCLNLRQQRLELPGIVPIGIRHLLRDDLLGIGIESQVPFAPSAPRRGTVLPGGLLAFAIDFQPRRIDHQVDRVVRRP